MMRCRYERICAGIAGVLTKDGGDYERQLRDEGGGEGEV